MFQISKFYILYIFTSVMKKAIIGEKTKEKYIDRLRMVYV
jgi:hypothetical protein